ncbi:MAG: Rho termination factor N-terminal domain-containing protein, partial [Spirochaetales bacterium]|nr:Rho termination factor N-terminal domain-containing protein [Spirochaetales bacterium]
MSDDSKKTDPVEVKVVQKELDLTVPSTEESLDEASLKVVVPRKRVKRKKVVAPVPTEVENDSDTVQLDRLKRVVALNSVEQEISKDKVESDSEPTTETEVNQNNSHTVVKTTVKSAKNNNSRNNGANNNRTSYTNRGRNNRNRRDNVTINSPLPTPDQPRILINDLTNLILPDLRTYALENGVVTDDIISLNKQEVIFLVLKNHIENKNGVVYAFGSLEILPDGYGFLRSPVNSYLPGNDDIYVSPSQIRLFNLKTGDDVFGQIRTPQQGERFFAMLRVEKINNDDPSVAQRRVPFESLTPLFPDERINMETIDGDVSTRMINLFYPIGKGQRGIIVAPPRTGKTVFLQKIA